MPVAWRTVRVFISSTFRDMHAERDHLVKVVFPALRERLEPHRVHLIDIELRWGVTKEQAENDRVLDLCLKQIRECRPFFVGILGARYGCGVVADAHRHGSLVAVDVSKGTPCQFRVIWQKSRCSILFHLLVPGG